MFLFINNVIIGVDFNLTSNALLQHIFGDDWGMTYKQMLFDILWPADNKSILNQ